MSERFESPSIPLIPAGQSRLYLSDQQRPGRNQLRKSANVGYRLAKRKELFKRRLIVSDFAFGFAVFGIALMMLETELYMAGMETKSYSKESTASRLVKSCISISTLSLLGFVIWYHILDVKLFMCDNAVEDWRLAIGRKTILKIIVELLAYSIHPPPGNYDYMWTKVDWETQERSEVHVPVDVFLAIPMLLRIFLLTRVLMLHSKLFTDASSQSLGALNRVNFTFSFIFKSMMTRNPVLVMTVLTCSGFLVSAWLLRACEMYHEKQLHLDFLDSMWVVAITFLTVGYGDIVPQSYCGRTMSVSAGIFGAGCTALVVAVLARKLELSRAEKYVHNFVTEVELDKRFKNASADVLKAGWYVYKYKTSGRSSALKLRNQQRLLLKSIQIIREVNEARNRLNDERAEKLDRTLLNDTVEKMETQNQKVNESFEQFAKQLERIELKLNMALQ